MINKIQIRNEMVKSFESTEEEYMQKSSKSLGFEKTSKETKEDILNLVKIAIKDAKANYEDPSKVDLLKVLDRLQNYARLAKRDEKTIQDYVTRIYDLIVKLD